MPVRTNKSAVASHCRCDSEVIGWKFSWQQWKAGVISLHLRPRWAKSVHYFWRYSSFCFSRRPISEKMLFGQKVQKFWEHIKKLYRSLIYSLRAFIWYKYELCSLWMTLLLLRPLLSDSLRCFAKSRTQKLRNFICWKKIGHKLPRDKQFLYAEKEFLNFNVS